MTSRFRCYRTIFANQRTKLAGRNRRYANHQPTITIPYNPLIFQGKTPLFSPGKTPVNILLHKAKRFDNMLKQGAAKTQAELAQKEGVSQPTVSRILSLPKLAPQIKEYIADFSNQNLLRHITGWQLEKITKIKDHKAQIKKFRELMKRKVQN